MKDVNKHSLLKEIDSLWNYYLQVRATYPYARPEHIGRTYLESASYYKRKGIHLRLEFGRPLTEQDIEQLRDLGYWVNQSVIIRLYALLEYYKVVSDKISINTTVSGHEDIDILRRLRQCFAHTGRYNASDNRQLKLFQRIVTHYELKEHDQDRFPIPIDAVIEVIFNRVREYVQQI